MAGRRRSGYLLLALVSIPALASPLRAQCKATAFSVPVPGSFADAGATCVAANLVDLGNGTVADRANHLLWGKAAVHVTPYTSFSDFMNYCGGLALGGRAGWYLPDVAQLQTLLPPSTCHAAMTGCGTGEPDDPYDNGILWASSAVEPESYYCPRGFGCHTYRWAVATGYGENFGVLTEVPGFQARQRVDARSVTDGDLVRCVADGLKLAIVPDPIKIPAGAHTVGGRVLTESRLPLTLTDYVAPRSGVQVTLRSRRSTLVTHNGPGSPTTAQGFAVAYVQTRDQNSPSTIDSTTPLVWTDPKGTITCLSAHCVDDFFVTCYRTSLESDHAGQLREARRWRWCGTYVPPAGLQYRVSFMNDVQVQGSGRSVGGQIIQYNPGPRCYYINTCPMTRTGDCATVGTTVAVDPAVIPLNASIAIDTIGAREAQDTGGDIDDYDIDLYRGFGLAACADWVNNLILGVDFQSY